MSRGIIIPGRGRPSLREALRDNGRLAELAHRHETEARLWRTLCAVCVDQAGGTVEFDEDTMTRVQEQTRVLTDGGGGRGRVWLEQTGGDDE